MPTNKTKQQNLTAKPQTGSVRKAPGTRIGTLFEWRDGSVKTANQRHGHTIRDGR
jgi:hypothetical protein